MQISFIFFAKRQQLQLLQLSSKYLKKYLYYIATGEGQKVTFAEKIMEFFH